MSFELAYPDWLPRAEPPPPPPPADGHRVESLINRFIAGKQAALFTAPDAFYRLEGGDAIDGQPAMAQRLQKLRTATLEQARDDSERAAAGPRLDLHIDDAMDGVGRHVARQRTAWQRRTIAERQTLIRRAAELDHLNDDKLGGLAEAYANAAQELARLNGEPEEPAAESARSALWRTALGQRLAAGDGAQAVALFGRIQHRLAPADRRHLDLPIQLAATDLVADRWIERATTAPGEPLAARAAADPGLSPAEKATVLTKIAERSSATESTRIAAVMGLDDRLGAANRALATAPVTYKPATFVTLANAYDDAGEPDRAAAVRRLAQQENILLRFARSSVDEQQRLIDVLPVDAQEAARAIQQQQDEAFARDPYAAGTALYPDDGPPLPAEDAEGRLMQTRMIEAFRGFSVTGEQIAEAQNDGADSNIVRASLPPDDETSTEPVLDAEQLAQAKKPPPAQPKPAPKGPAAPAPKPTPEELAERAIRRAERVDEFNEIMRTPPVVTQSHQLLPDDAQLTPDALRELDLDPKTFRYFDQKKHRSTPARPTLLASIGGLGTGRRRSPATMPDGSGLRSGAMGRT